MKKIFNRTGAFILSLIMLFSCESFSFAAETENAMPGEISLELQESEYGILLDVTLLNITSLCRVELDLSYDTKSVYLEYCDFPIFDFLRDHSLSYADVYYSYEYLRIDPELDLNEATDIPLFTYNFGRNTPVLTNGATFNVQATIYYNEEDEDYVTYSASASLPKEKIDPEIFPDAIRSGDVDGDNKVTANDARCALRFSVGLDMTSSLVEQYADVDSDFTVSAADARILLRTSVGLDSEEALPYFFPEEHSEDDYFSYDDFNITYVTALEGKTKSLANVFIRKGSKTKWTSSNPAAVTVDQNGKITAKKKGFSCIILEYDNEKFYFEVTVRTEVQERIDALRDKYPDGYYWNNHTPSKKYPHVTETPCSDHAERKYKYCKGQCAGFAALLYSEVFPNAKKKTGVTWDNIKIGDYVRLKRHHSIFIIDVIKSDDIVAYDYYSGENVTAGMDYVSVAHCNWYSCCNIQWDYIFTDDYEIDSSLSYTAY